MINKLINRKEVHIVPQLEEEVRLSDYVPGIFKAITSKKGMKKAIENNQVKVNGIVSPTSKYIRGGETIEFSPAELNIKINEFRFKLVVVFEDEHLAVIEKPAGIIVSGNKFRTIENALAFNLNASTLVDVCPHPKPAHRLDFPTSGLLLIAKTASCVTALNKMFESRTIDKTYTAITIGKMKKKGVINTPIKTKTTETHFEVLKTVDSKRFEQLNLVKLTPITGRRHQLRIHMQEIGNPILGDAKYGTENKILEGKGLFLHASNLEFIHPFTEKQMKLELELPKKFYRIFEK